jgi:transcriptional regulator with AAA-type ATPase domain/tetratricopeptide (TPR) repeat protein
MEALAELLGESPAMTVVRDRLHKVLESQAAGRRLPALLIQGETGTGKGLVARLVHRLGPRRGGPFVDINCPAIPETLLEAELFGFERGAFTDARHAKPGLFQTAHRGTLFLDEVGLLPASAQAKLLTVVEERVVRRLGSTRPEPVDVWLISATNTDLREAVRARRFREDLYHRLAVITLHLPPLRERGRDVLLLAERFLARACLEYGLPLKCLSEEAQTRLLAYPWPGNIRELANVIERAGLFAESAVITGAMLEPLSAERTRPAAPATSAIAVTVTPEEATRQHLLRVLEQSAGNISHAAARLGIARNTLYARLEKYGVRAHRPHPVPPHGAGRPANASAPAPTATRMRWERRGITLLCAALVESDGRDSWSQTSRALEVVINKLQTFGGRVEELTPTGIVASFGVDQVEDAPRRAAHAAMVIHKRAERAREDKSRPPRVKIGIHVAEVLVGRSETRIDIDADAKRAQWPVLDQLLQLIDADQTVASAAAAPFLERRFELIPIDVGQGDSGQPYRLTGQERRGLGLWGAMTQFVGRQEEIEVLRGCLAAAGHGRGQLVAVVGEPGVGKSRLCWEFTHSAPLAGWLVLEAGAVPYGKTTPYLPVIGLLKAYYGIVDRDDRRAIREKVAGKLLALDRAFEVALPAFLTLLDLPVDDRTSQALDPAGRRRRTLDALKRLLLRESQVQPVALVFEDLHWIDGETQALLDSLVEGLPGARLLLLVSYRSEYAHDWGLQASYTQLRIEPLPRESAEVLLEVLLGSDPGLDPLKRLLIERTEGNPLFVEESVRALVETGTLTGPRGAYQLARGLPAIHVPATVQAIMTARIDRLPSEEKRLLEIAAVVGKDFPLSLLQAVADQGEEMLRHGLGRLQAAEFLYETSVFPDTEYTFKHALTHEVAYGSLLLGRRRQLHAQIVDVIERLYADRLGEHIERLAHHAVHGEVWDRAVDYLRKAGTKAYARGALNESRERYQQGLDLLARLPATPENIRRGIDVRLDLHGPLVGLAELSRMIELHQEAEGLARQLQDRPRLGRIASRMSNFAWLDAGYASAIERAQAALQIAAATDDPAVQIAASEVRITATHMLGLTYLALGQYRRCVDLLRQNVEGPDASLAHERIGFTIPPYIFGCGLLAWGFAALGDFTTALAYGQEGIDAAEASGYFQAQAAAYLYQATALVSRGEFGAALPLCERGVRLGELGAVGFWRAFAYSMWGWALACSDDVDQGLPHLERGAVLQEGVGIKAIRSIFWTRWAEGLLLGGDLLEAKRAGIRGLELAEASGERGFAAEACHVLARIAAGGGAAEFDAAYLHYERASALADELGMRPLHARCHLGVASLYRRMAKIDQARWHLTTAMTMFRGMDMRFWLEQAEAEVTRLRD